MFAPSVYSTPPGMIVISITFALQSAGIFVFQARRLGHTNNGGNRENHAEIEQAVPEYLTTGQASNFPG